MKILAIETSCDDTGIAILEAKGIKNPAFCVLANVVSSQVKLHRKYGGVYPSLAKREHQKNLVPVLKETLESAKLFEKTQSSKFKAQNQNLKLKTLKGILEREEYLFKELKVFLLKYKKPKIDVIAVTIGPGLEPCLWTGVNFAKALGFWWNLKIIPINHIEAHIMVNFIDQSQKSKVPLSSRLRRAGKSQKLFPAISLVVSGGHTQLAVMKNFGEYRIIGETRDDAAGECFDKTARILGLGYPGGPVISTEASKLQTTNAKLHIKLPRPMINSKDYDFSFSGLKTAVLYDFKTRDSKTRKSKKYIREMAKEIQQSAVDVLIKKTLRAAKDFRAKSIILGGGVTANKELREQLSKKIGKELPNVIFLKPLIQFCTDNAAMVAASAYFNKNQKKNWQKIQAEANLRIN